MLVTQQLRETDKLLREKHGNRINIEVDRKPYLLEPKYSENEDWTEAHLDRITRKFAKHIGAQKWKKKWDQLTEEEQHALEKFVHQRKNCGPNPDLLSLNERAEILGYRFMEPEKRICSSTVRSHRLVEWASQKRPRNRKKTELLYDLINRKHFLDGKLLNSTEMLVEAAKEAGFDGEEVREFLNSTELREEVLELAEQSRDRLDAVGIKGIPCTIIPGLKNEETYFHGVQPPNIFIKAFEAHLV